MPEMRIKLTKKYRAKHLILFFLLCLPIKDVLSSPWVTPDDALVKHDLQILSDAGLLNIPINTWPIAWGDVAYNLKVDDPKGLSPETLLSLQRIKQRLIDEQMGGISADASADMPPICSCLLYTSPSPRDKRQSRMPSSA